jgi:hypothetical protein
LFPTRLSHVFSTAEKHHRLYQGRQNNYVIKDIHGNLMVIITVFFIDTLILALNVQNEKTLFVPLYFIYTCTLICSKHSKATSDNWNGRGPDALGLFIPVL